MRVPGGLFLFAHFNGNSGRYRIPSIFNVASNAFLIHAKRCVFTKCGHKDQQHSSVSRRVASPQLRGVGLRLKRTEVSKAFL